MFNSQSLLRAKSIVYPFNHMIIFFTLIREWLQMGNVLYTEIGDMHDDREVIYRLSPKDAAAMKNIWKVIDGNMQYYSSAFSTTLFTRHPEYRKFFAEEYVPQFIQESKVQKKFTSVCSVISVLFSHYYHKPLQREYLLGYIAMVHKDMGLSHSDLDNFICSLVDTLLQELPTEMTPGCTVAQIRCLKTMIRRLDTLMQEQRENMLKFPATNGMSTNICRKIFKCDIDSVYGRPMHYWMSQKEYWEYRKSMWSMIGVETSTVYMPDTGVITKSLTEGKLIRTVQRRSSARSRSLDSRKYSLESDTITKKHGADRGQYPSRPTLKDSRYRKFLQDRTRLRQNTRSFSRYSYMDPIPEQPDGATSGSSMTPRATESRQAFLEAVKALKAIASTDSNLYSHATNGDTTEKKESDEGLRNGKDKKRKAFNAAKPPTNV